MSDANPGQRSKGYRDHRPWQDLDKMLSVAEARERILSQFSPTELEQVALIETHGRMLARPAVAESAVPPFRNSAMDGYAVRAGDLEGASYENPVSLKVVAELPAGVAPVCRVGADEAIRIMTGAVMPEGADTVVRFEETDELQRGNLSIGPAEELEVRIHRSPGLGANVREAGEDIEPGATVLEAGTTIRAAEMGVLASINQPGVTCRRRPRVGILATGDEVVEPGEKILPGQIRNSNNFTLAGLVHEAGGTPIVLGVARDDAQDLQGKLQDTGTLDLLITSGGVSVGDYDVVKDVLQANGNIDLWQVRIKPGKPMAFGHLNGVPLIGLPGNPVAAYVAFIQFGHPAIRTMLGASDLDLPRTRARLTCEHENRGHRMHFVRGHLRHQDGEQVVEPVPTQGSGVLMSVVNANCLFVIPEELNHAPAGLEVDVIPLTGYD